MRKLDINVCNETYNIIVENNLISNANEYIKEVYKNKNIFVITDDTVYKLYYEKLKKSLEKDYIVDVVVFPHGEESKNINTYINICVS